MVTQACLCLRRCVNIVDAHVNRVCCRLQSWLRNSCTSAGTLCPQAQFQELAEERDALLARFRRQSKGSQVIAELILAQSSNRTNGFGFACTSRSCHA